MATKTISVRNEVDGVLTDLTACTLSDPGETFGVRDVETGEVVVADGAAFTHDGTGLYSYVVTGLTAGREYQAYVARAYLGETSRESVFFLPAAASETYSTDGDVDNAYGPDNVTAWADLNDNADADEISARKVWGRNKAYREMNDAMRAEGLTVPATADNFPGFSSLADIEADVAGFHLHRSRGVSNQQASGLNADEIQDNYTRAMARLAGLISEAVDAQNIDDATAGQDGIGIITLTGCPTTRACCDLPVVIL